jgi:integrase
MNTVKIPAGLRGSIYQRGRNSYRVQLSIGRGPDGEYQIKRETIRGREQDAVDLLTRWNVQYLDHQITTTNYETVREAYEQWIEHVRAYRTPNTHRFYRERFERDLLPEIGRRRLKDITLAELQRVLTRSGSKDVHNKRALSAFLNRCADMDKCPRLDLRRLETRSRPRPKSESDVWSFDQVRRVCDVLGFDTLYDIFIVLGIECGLRPQEILALTWDRVHPDYLTIDRAIKERTPKHARIGLTKTEQVRRVPTTRYLMDKLRIHKTNQEIRATFTAGYDRQANLVVADALGHVADRRYIRRYLFRVADRAKVPRIPPKNLRSTYISLMNDLGVPLTLIQQAVGHSRPDTTTKHYIRIFSDSLQAAADALHNRLHGNG